MSVLRTLPRWAILLGVALLTRALTFGNPIVHVDEAFYYATADAMRHGAIPYVDVWDRKPVGLFLLYLPAAALGLPWGIFAYQALALACVTATALLIARLAERAGWARGAMPAALAYLFWLNLLEGEGGQTPVFYNLLMVGAAWLLAPRRDDAAEPGRRFGHGLAALGLVGLAAQIKYSVVFEGMFFGLWWSWREWRLGRPLWQGLALSLPLAGAAALPTLAAWGWFAAHGFGDAFVYANFESIGSRHANPVIEQIANLAVLTLTLLPLIVLMGFVARLPRAGDFEALMRRWIFGWVIVATLAVLGFGAYFDHYGLPLLVPYCLCSAGFFALHRYAARATVPLLIVGFVASQIFLLGKINHRGTGPQLRAIAAAIGQGEGCLYVFSGSPQLYTYTGRCALTRYRFPSHLGLERERGAIGVDQQAEVARIMAERPAILVMAPRFNGERKSLRDYVQRVAAAEYREKADLPLGRERITVYARR